MADADTIYRVLTVYDADTSKAKAGTDNLASALDHLTHLAAEAKDLVREMVGRILEVGSAAEQAKISIAGLFQANGLTFGNDFNTALAMSTEMLAKMRRDAAALPGTFEDLTAIMQRAIPGGAQAGQSANRIEALSAKLMGTFSGQMPAEFIGRELAEMMEGRASSRVALFARLKQYMGHDMDSTKFNALSAPEKWAALEQAMSHFDDMLKAQQGTWSTISSTAESYWTNVIRVGSAGVFDMLKQDLADVNAWYERNEETILKVARTIGDDLGGAIDFVIQMIRGSIDAVVEWLEYFGIAKDDADAVRVLVEAVSIGVGVITAIIGVTTAWTVAQWALNAAMFANPFGLVILAVGVLMGMIGALVAELDNFYDTWVIITNDPAMQAVAKRMGLDLLDAVTGGNGINRDPGAAQAARERMAKREVDHQQLYGSTGFTGDVKAMLDRYGLLPGTAALSHGNMGNLANAGDLMGMMTGVNPNRAGMPDAKALLDRAGKPVTQHITNVGAVNLYTNIYDNEDPARVVDHLVNKIRGGLEHPSQSPSVPVYR